MSTAMTTQQPLPGLEQYRREPSAMEILKDLASRTDDPQVAVAVAKSMVELQQSMEKFQWEREERQAKTDFDEALNRCQQKLGRIATDANNPQTHSRYATYAKLDSVLRPIYTAESFSLSFGERDCPTPGKTRFVAFLSRSGLTREYLKDMTASTKGPKGNDVMTPVHAEGALDSYARRYLLKSIFNVAIGEDDADGNISPAMTEKQEAELQDYADALRQCPDLPQLKNVFADAYKFAGAINAQEKSKMARIYEDCKRRFL